MTALPNAIRASAAEFGERIALTDGTNHLRYCDLAIAIDDMAALIQEEAGSGGPIALELDNSIDGVIADLALLSLERPCVPLPPFFTAAQREAALSNAGAAASITPQGITILDLPAMPVPEGTAKISYTSGSTGTPKGVCLSDTSMLATARSVIGRVGIETAGIHLPLLPLAVLLENVAGLYATLLAGGCYHAQPLREIGLARLFDPSAGQMLAAIERTRATSLILVPELLGRLVAEIEATGRKLPSLRLVAVGGAHVATKLIERADRLELPLVQGYGLTECGSVVAIETPGDRTGRGTVGRPLDHVRVLLNSDGEILVVGNGHLGLVGEPRALGAIHTGDIGQFDHQGRLSIIGRKSNLIVTTFGRNVAPEWVETVLTDQPAIAQAMVTGDGAASLSALVVPSSPIMDVAAGIAAANAALPAYARIAEWRITKAFLPSDGTLTSNGRLRRAEIAARETRFGLFDRLMLQTAPARAHLLRTPQIAAALGGRISRETYVTYLAQAYHHVRHTVPLMLEARARLAHRPKLQLALDDYIKEETGHELWILDDIAAAGADPAQVIAQGPSAATAAMVDHAYRTIRGGNPASFFGMIYVLESTSIALAGQGAEAVRLSLNLPEAAFTYLTSHGILDQDHMRVFEALMNEIEDPADAAAIIAMANDIFHLFSGMFAAIPMEGSSEAA